MEPIWAVGLMTGTVLDGNIDVALIKTDGERIDGFRHLHAGALPAIDPRPCWRRRCAQARTWNFDGPEPAIFREAEEALTRAQSAAVKDLVESYGLTHGRYRRRRLSRPDGAASRAATRPARRHAPARRRRADARPCSGTKVAYDFRSADVRAGGQGAPLAAAYHTALLRSAGASGDTAVLNLGGVANITWWDGADNVDRLRHRAGQRAAQRFHQVERASAKWTATARLAAPGTVDEARLAELLQHPYLTKPYPKSLDRFDFGAAMADGLNAEDGAATLTAFTAAAVGKALDLLPHRPKRLVVSGGGRHNPTMMAMLASRAGVEVVQAEALGWSGDAVEAECFAFLAVRVLRGLPISFPSTTGVPQPMRGGRLAG